MLETKKILEDILKYNISASDVVHSNAEKALVEIDQLQAENKIFRTGCVPRDLCPDCRDQCLEKATKYLWTKIEELQAENRKYLLVIGETAIQRDKLKTKLAAANIALGQIYDVADGFIVEVIDVLRGRAVWDEHGVAEYPGKKENDADLCGRLAKGDPDRI